MARRLAWVVLASLGAAPAAEPALPPPSQLNADDPCDDLALAAACLDRGEDAAAAGHLSRHLTAHPDRPSVRFSLAEVHWRRDRLADAGVEYDRFVRDVPPRPATVHRLVQAHTRLVAVAAQAGDAYSEHLH